MHAHTTTHVLTCMAFLSSLLALVVAAGAPAYGPGRATESVPRNWMAFGLLLAGAPSPHTATQESGNTCRPHGPARTSLDTLHTASKLPGRVRTCWEGAKLPCQWRERQVLDLFSGLGTAQWGNILKHSLGGRVFFGALFWSGIP